jgi:hypothetical protein
LSDVDKLVEAMVDAAERAIREERGSLVYQAERVTGLTLEFSISPGQGIHETFAYVTRRAIRGKAADRAESGGAG